MKTILFLLLFSLPAQAQNFFCRADFDEGSHYELASASGKEILFGYKTNDGLDLQAELITREFNLEQHSALRIKASNENMGVELETTYKQNKYSGLLRVSFSLDSVEFLELPVDCTLGK